MKIDGVVVFFKPNEDNINNISTYLPYLNKLFIVDNTPNGDLSERFTQDNIEYIPLKENTGIAHAQNIGAKKAIDDGATWLLTMDQDSKFDGDGLKQLEDSIEIIKSDKEKFRFVGIDYDHIGIISPFHVTKETVGNAKYAKGIEFPVEVMSSGNLVNLEAYKAVDGFKDWMFIDCVDFAFCFDLLNKNYQIIQLNFVKLDHSLGNIERHKILWKTFYTENHSAFRWYYMARNRLYLNELYQNSFSDFCKLEIKVTKKEILKIILFEKSKIKKLKAIHRGRKAYKNGLVGDQYHEKKRNF